MFNRKLLCNLGCSFKQPNHLLLVHPGSRPSGPFHSRFVGRGSDTHLKWHDLSKLLFVLIVLFALANPWRVAIAGSGSPSQENSSANQAEAQVFYEAGMRLIQQKHVETAIQTFKQGLRRDSQNAVLLNAIGAAYSLKNDTQKGDHYFLAALNINPQFAPARRNLAISYFNRGSFDLASREFELLRQNPENRQVASLFLGMLAAKKAEYSRAIEFFDESGNLLYQYPDSILYFAQALYQSQQKRESQRVLSRLRDGSNVSADDWFQAGILYSHLGQYQQALDAFGGALQKNPQAPQVRYEEALVLSKMGHFHDALDVLQKLTAQNPDNDSLNLLGHVAEDVGNVQLALHAFRKAAEVAPNATENYLDFSTLCMNYGNNAVALDVIRAGLAHLPRSYRLTVQKGAILDNLRRQQEAEEAFRSAMRLQSDNREAFLGLAIAQTHANQFNDAIRTFAAAVEKFPKDSDLHYYYAFALFRLAEHSGMKGQAAERAKQAIERTIQLNPGSARSYYLLAKLNLNENNPRLAEENLKTCLRLHPRYVPAKYQLAMTYLKTGKRQEGESLLKEIQQAHAQELRKEQTEPRIELVKR